MSDQDLGVSKQKGSHAYTRQVRLWFLAVQCRRGTSDRRRSDVDFVARTEATFCKLADEYRSRKEFSEANVRDWKWASWCWFEIRPLYFERNGWAPGRILRHAPANLNGRVECGLDRVGRVAVERGYNEHGFYETFYDWTSEPIEVAHFDYCPEKMPINLMLVQMDAGRAVECFRSAIHGFTCEEYQWVGSAVREVKVHHAKRVDGKLGALRPLHIARAHYDEQCVVQRVELLWPPAPPQRPEEVVELMFERRGKQIYRKRT